MTACVLCVFAACGPNGGGSGVGSKEEGTENNALRFTPGEDGNWEVSADFGFYASSVVIPSEYNGKPVTGIAGGAFENIRSLKSVTVPDGIKTIGARAFEDAGLTSITLPDSVEFIREYAFAGTELSSIKLPKNLRMLGSSVFSGCTIESIVVPDGVDDVVHDTFEDLHLRSATAPAYVATIGLSGSYESRDTLETLTVTTGDELGGFDNFSALRSVTVNEATNIAPGAFADCNALERVTLGEGVEVIGRGAFANIGSAREIKLPSTLVKIDVDAFKNSNIQKLDIADVGAWCGIEFGGPRYSNEHHFLQGVQSFCLDGQPLDELVIPDGVTKIPDYAFAECYFQSITVLESVTEIGLEAFQYSGAQKLTIPPFAIDALWKLNPTEVTVTGGEIEDDAFNDSNSSRYSMLQKLTLQNVVRINGGPFGSLPALQTLEIGDGLEYILSGGIFSGCPQLEYNFDGETKYLGNADNPRVALISVDPALTEFDVDDGTSAICDDAFRGCSELARLDIPRGIKRLAGFRQLVKLAAVTGAEDVTEVADSAFEGCTKLATISLSKLVTVGAHAFSKTALTEMSMPEVKTIGQYAFEQSKLASVDMPEVDFIGYRAFAQTKLTEVTLPYDIEEISGNVFCGCKKLECFYKKTPDGSFDDSDCDYRFGTDQIVNVKTKTLISYAPASAATEPELILNAWDIGDYAFYDCDNIEKITVAGSAKKIGEHAFENCSKLATVTVRQELRSIGDSAFSGCASLRLLEVKTNASNEDPLLNYIGRRAFHNCPAFTDVTYEGPTVWLWTHTISARVVKAEDWIDVGKTVTVTFPNADGHTYIETREAS